MDHPTWRCNVVGAGWIAGKRSGRGSAGWTSRTAKTDRRYEDNLSNTAWTERVKGSVKWSMKKWAKTKRLDWTLKIADISVRDRFPPPLTAHKRTAVGDSPTAKNSRTVRDFSVVYSSVAVFLRAIKGTAAGAVAGLLPLAWNLRTVRAFGWQI